MIRISSLYIEEFRGLHRLSLTPGGENFAVCGPNGTGKSGVVDALEFAITGAVTRLTGQGTSGITLKLHAPHVDARDKPDQARVILGASIPSLKKSFTIERRVDAPNEPIITPDDPDVISLVRELENHPEFALSRREIIKYVLAAPGDRSKEVQALLRLDRVEKVRQNFQSIANGCKSRLKILDQAQERTQAELVRALGVAFLKKDLVIAAANKRREALGLEALTDLRTDTSLKSGLGAVAAPSTRQRVSKTQALADIATFADRLSMPEDPAITASRHAVIAILEKLKESPLLLTNLRRETFLRTGLELLDEEACPFCENYWELALLRSRIESRLGQAREAADTKRALQSAAAPFVSALQTLESAARVVADHARYLSTGADIMVLANWTHGLRSRRENNLSLDNLEGEISAFSRDYRGDTEQLVRVIGAFQAAAIALPDPSKEEEARDYLTICQEKLEAYREAKRQEDRARQEGELAQRVLDLYNSSSTKILAQIYKDVQKDFSDYYRVINREDEAEFEGKLTPSLGKLGFDVDFYGRGFFPPGAYHSEGHQDSMGLCLYLALMKHTLGRKFTFAVLDDVLMSVDAGHRREICALFKTKFPTTQFLITTHDPIWLQHMATEQLVPSRATVHFRKWTVDDGPIVWDGTEVWDEIKVDLERDNVPGAAGTLRRYLEYMAGLLSHRLRANIEFRGDAQYDLGDLMPAVVAAFNKLLSKAQEAAQSWNKKDEGLNLSSRQKVFSAKVGQSNVEQWAINRSIHYNEWARLTRQDFKPVVEAFKGMLECFRCETCSGLVYVSPGKGPKESLRCDCGAVVINLKIRSKS